MQKLNCHTMFYELLLLYYTILHILMQQTIYHETKHNYACHTVEMNNFSFIYTIIQQLCSNLRQCLLTIQKEKQTNYQSNSHTMLNLLTIKNYYKCQKLSNIVIRNENLQTRLLSLSDQYYYYPVWDLSRYLETQRELLSRYIEVIGQWFMVSSSHHPLMRS